ncbi:MAG: hypothetical protein QOF78_1849 [Phycisphaerales bacterium]|jgi:hypothetical protein|nr:hypothetical protein [Phycisphaerales bacterium]
MGMENVIDHLLSAQAIEPILVDVGSSGGSPRIWQPIRAHSTYVGFDGDTREMHHPQEAEYRHACFAHEVITSDGDAAVTFYLTRSPYCSSTLKPNPAITDNFLSADSFIIERTEKAKASTLNAVLDRLNLPHIDWMKIDTQGTDLRVYNSLRKGLRDKLLAIDIEPGLRGAYVNEDLFCDVHAGLMREGFWLSNLKVCGLVRMRKSTLDWLADRDAAASPENVAKAVRQTPGWTECRYLRSLESLEHTGATRREYVLLWVIALIDKQLGFCLDLALEHTRLFGEDELSKRLEAESIERIDQAVQAAKTPKKQVEITVFGRVKRKVRRVLWPGG